MLIVPAIDLLDGKVVRLLHGDYAKVTHYSDDPLTIAHSFVDQGYSWLHVIDLVGAKAGSPQAKNEIESILSTGLNVQVGGGIRTIQNAQEYFSMGVKRIIIGTQAIINPVFIDQLLHHFPADFIVVSLDVRHGNLAVNGWLQESTESIQTRLELLQNQGIKRLIVTDITRDGTLSGINEALYQPLVLGFPNLEFYAAGGVGSYADIDLSKRMGLAGVIVGKAFYENKMGGEKSVR